MNPENNKKAYLAAKYNIISVLSLSIKKILEKACFQETLDDFCDEVVNFLIILDHVIYFCMKGTDTMFSPRMPNHPWKLFYKRCQSIPNNCVNTISQITSISNNFSKLRALLKMALIEKRLSVYMSTAFSDINLNRKFYSQNSIILSERFPELLNELVGLEAIDFSFDLKLNMNHPGFNPIDYSMYLKYYPSAESVLDDLKECKTFSDSQNHYCFWKEKYDLIFEKCKKESKQKSYLEEILSIKEVKLDAAENRNTMIAKELKTMEESVTELQVQLTLLHEEYTKELKKLGGNPDDLKVPIPHIVIGSRADLTSSRHRLTAQMSEIERSIRGETLPSCCDITQVYTHNCKGDNDFAVNNHNTTDDNDLGNSQSDISEKNEIKTQKMTKVTKHYYSPSNNDFRKYSTDFTQSFLHHPNHVEPAQSHSSRINQLLYNNQTARILESQKLRKMIGKANRSPLIKAHHRHSLYLFDDSISSQSQDNYDIVDSMEDFASSFNTNNIDREDASPGKRKHATNRIHSPSDPETYYHLSSAFVSEELVDDNYFEIHSETANVEVLQPPIVLNPIIQAPYTPSNGSAYNIISTVQVMSPPDIIRLSPLITAEVPEDIEPITSQEHRHVNSSTNGDRNSPNQNH